MASPIPKLVNRPCGMSEIAYESRVTDKIEKLVRRDKANSKSLPKPLPTFYFADIATKHFLDMGSSTEALVLAETICDDDQGHIVWINKRHVIKDAIVGLDHNQKKICTKTAAKYFAELASEYSKTLRSIIAMCLTSRIAPDVLPSESYDQIVSGYYPRLLHDGAMRVDRACSTKHSHWTSADLNAALPQRGSGSWSWAQQSIASYSTYELALRAGRAMLAWRYAEELAEIDQKIEAAQKTE